MEIIIITIIIIVIIKCCYQFITTRQIQVQKISKIKFVATRDNLLRPNCDSDGKADNKPQAFINTTTRSFKIQTGDMSGTPPPPGRASSNSPFHDPLKMSAYVTYLLLGSLSRVALSESGAD